MDERGANSGAATEVADDDHHPIHDADSDALGLLRIEERLWLVLPLLVVATLVSELDLLGNLPDKEGCDSIITIVHQPCSYKCIYTYISVLSRLGFLKELDKPCKYRRNRRN